jgi:glucose/arabinose dehydrogenase
MVTISATRVATGLNEPVFATAPPGDFDHLFIVERTGQIKILDLTTGEDDSVFLDVSDQISTAGESGLLGLAFDPNYAENGHFYIHLINTSGDTEIRRYQVSSGDPKQADPATEMLIITVDQPDDPNHKGGWIGFGPDGYLYVALGDGSVHDNAQDIGSVLGKIIRIDVTGDDYPTDTMRNYSIPSDNPFIDTAGARPEIWALGLRNPFRASFDRVSGEFYIGDVGEHAFEEIDIGQAGGNYGWDVFEGPALSEPGPLGPGVLTDPIYFYPGNEAAAVIGGYVYRGEDTRLQGQYFFADFVRGDVLTLEKEDTIWVATDRTDQIAPDIGTIDNPTSFAEDEWLNVYLIDFDGDVFRLGDNVPCFCRGTLILTVRGEVPVEDLAIGDQVKTLSGSFKPIVWIGFGRTLVTRANRLARPIMVRRGALADDVPRRDLYLTHGHALYFDGVLIPVEHLVNHRSIAWDDTARVVGYYHIELEDHDVLFADGAPAESYYDASNRALFQNTREGSQPRVAKPACAPVLNSGEIVGKVWAQLFERAGGQLDRQTTDNADLHLVVDGERINPTAIEGGVYSFAVQRPPARGLRLCSRSGVPSLLGLSRHDHRPLGVAIKRVILHHAGIPTCFDYDAPQFREGGCHLPEDGYSWTDGEFELPARFFTLLNAGFTLAVHTAPHHDMRYPIPPRITQASARHLPAVIMPLYPAARPFRAAI